MWQKTLRKFRPQKNSQKNLDHSKNLWQKNLLAKNRIKETFKDIYQKSLQVDDKKSLQLDDKKSL